MPVIHFILKDGTIRTVEAPAGMSVMEAAVRNNVRGIEGECGGCCSCATCHVYVEPTFAPHLAAPDDLETEMLGCVAAQRQAGSRLGCQILIDETLDGLTVRMPDRQA